MVYSILLVRNLASRTLTQLFICVVATMFVSCDSEKNDTPPVVNKPSDYRDNYVGQHLLKGTYTPQGGVAQDTSLIVTISKLEDSAVSMIGDNMKAYMKAYVDGYLSSGGRQPDSAWFHQYYLQNYWTDIYGYAFKDSIYISFRRGPQGAPEYMILTKSR